MPVLVADAVGYSRLREEDGAGTLVAIGDPQTSILDPAVQARQGRIAEPRRLVFAAANSADTGMTGPRQDLTQVRARG